MSYKKNLQNPKRAFRDMWVAGTLGAFFTALTRNLPLHFNEFSWTPNTEYTLDLIIRHGYIVWLLTYFFVSNLDNASDDNPRCKDLAFDIIQSIVSLWAVFSIGFALPGHGYGYDSFGQAHSLISVNLAVSVICGFSLIFFHSEDSVAVNLTRLIGLVLSSGLILLIFFGDISGINLLIAGILILIILTGTLIGYIGIR